MEPPSLMAVYVCHLYSRASSIALWIEQCQKKRSKSVFLDAPMSVKHGEAPYRVPLQWTKHVKHPLWFLSICSNVAKCLLECPFSGQKVGKCPLGCTSSGQNVPKNFHRAGAPPHTTSALFTIFTTTHQTSWVRHWSAGLSLCACCIAWLL